MSAFVRGEGLNKFSVEMYLVIFRKLPNFIFRLTPHNLQKSLAFSSRVFLPLTGFCRRYTPWTQQQQQQSVIRSHSRLYFARKLSLLIGWFNWDQLRSMRWSKWAAFKIPKFSGRRYFSRLRRSLLAAPPPKLNFVRAIPPATQANTIYTCVLVNR